MANEVSKFIRLTDASGTLFDGNPIVLHVNQYDLNGENVIQFKGKGFQQVGFTTEDEESYVKNYSRRKGNVSYKGLNNMVINLGGFMSDNIGSDVRTFVEGDYKILTPTRFMKLVTSGKTFYLMDDTVVSKLSAEDVDGSQFYTNNGIPVIIKSFKMNPLIDEAKGINWNMTLMEDK